MRTLTSPPTADTSTVAPSSSAPMSGSGAPPRASTSMKLVAGGEPATRLPVTVKDTEYAGKAPPSPLVPAYGVAVTV